MKSVVGLVATLSSSLMILTGCAAGASVTSPGSTDAPPTRGAANSKLLGSRICFTSSNTPFDVRQAGGEWAAVAVGTESCVNGFASSSIPRPSDNGATTMWVDVRADVRLYDGSQISFYADNPLIGFPTAGWSTAPDAPGWQYSSFNTGQSTWVNFAGRGFNVERRSDSADSKEFLVKI